MDDLTGMQIGDPCNNLPDKMLDLRFSKAFIELNVVLKCTIIAVGHDKVVVVGSGVYLFAIEYVGCVFGFHFFIDLFFSF